MRETSLNAQDFSSAESPTQGITYPYHRCIRQNKIKFGSQEVSAPSDNIIAHGREQMLARAITAALLTTSNRKINTSTKRPHFFKHVRGLVTNKDNVMGPSGARYNECLCWRRPASNLLLCFLIQVLSHRKWDPSPMGNYLPIFFFSFVVYFNDVVNISHYVRSNERISE
jgi:hypothetical protein